MTLARPEHTTATLARPSAPVEGLDRDAAVVLSALRAGLVPRAVAAPRVVTWWRPTGYGNNVTADQRRADDEGTPDPHEVMTLPELGAELDRVRRRRDPKRTNAAPCGGSYVATERDGRSVFLRRAEHLRGVSLVQIDVDGHAGDALRMVDAARALESLGVAALLHPSPSSRHYLEAVKFRVWIAVGVAVEGATSVPVRHRADDLDHAVKATLQALSVACFAGARVDRSVWNCGAIGYVDREHDTAAGPCLVLGGADLDPYAVRDALVAIGAWEPYQRGAKASRDGEALHTMLRELGAHAPGVIGDARPHGAYNIACPLAHLHTDPATGRGSDSSCVLLVPQGLLKCSHQHQGRGQLSGRSFVAAIAEQWPAFAARAWALWGEASSRRPDDIRAQVFAGAPGETSDPRVMWDRRHDGAAVLVHDTPAAATAHINDDMRDASQRWERGDRGVRVRLDAAGTGKSTAAARALVALAPPLPGEMDNRPDTLRPVGVYCVENIKAAADVAARIDAAGRGEGDDTSRPGGMGDLVLSHAGAAGLVPLRRGRHERPVRAAVYLPVSAVGVDGRRVEGDAPRACSLWRIAEQMETSSHGVNVRASLCGCAGTDDPKALRHAARSQRGPCPRSGDCVAEQPWHYSDGTPPQQGDAWVAVATTAAAAAAPPCVMGSTHIVDETERATEAKPLDVLPSDVAADGSAAALVEVLAADRPDAPRRALDAARWVYAAALDVLRVQGPRVLYDGPQETAARRAWFVTAVDAWASERPDDARGRQVLRAFASMYDGPAGDTMTRAELRAVHIGAAVDAFMRAAPVVARWSAARWRRGDHCDVTAHVWYALRAWLHGALAVPHYGDDPAKPDDPRAKVPTGGASVHPWSAVMLAARGWNLRGPVIFLDATCDVSLIASALNAGAPDGTVSGVRAVATELRETADVRRVMVTTDRATRNALLRAKRGDDGGRVSRVQWEHHNGAAAATIACAVLAVLSRDAPTAEGKRLAPGVIVAARPLSLALRALVEGPEGAAVLAADVGPDLAAVARDDAATAPAAVREAAERFRARASRVWWTWPGSALARGSNDPHQGGARWVATIGDGLVNPRSSETKARLARRLDADGAPDVTAQQQRDAAAVLAQAHRRVRAQHITGRVLLVHFGTVRPYDWRPDAMEYITLAALRESFRPSAAAPVEAPGAAKAPSSARVVTQQRATLPAPLADAVAAGWSQRQIAGGAGVSQRTAENWCAGKTAPGAEHMEALRRALETTADETRAGYRALFLPGRRSFELVNGKGSKGRPSPGIVWYSAKISGELRAEAIRASAQGRPPPTRHAEPLTAETFGPRGEGLRAWAEGRAELAPHVVETLAAILPAMTREWIGYGRTPGPKVARPSPPVAGTARAVTALAARAPSPPPRAAGDVDA